MLLLSLSAAASLFTATPTPPTTTAPCDVVHSQVTNGYLESARTFAITGELPSARRNYRIAAMLSFDEGCLPEAASSELATLLLTEAKEREAAKVMRELARAARRRGEYDVEARARIASAWLALQLGDRADARTDVERLAEIAAERRVSSDTRALIDKALRRR